MTDYLAQYRRMRWRSHVLTGLLWGWMVLYAYSLGLLVSLIPVRPVTSLALGVLALVYVSLAEYTRRQREYHRFVMLWSWMQHEMALQDVTDEGELLIDQIPGTAMLVGRRVHTLRLDVPFFRPAGL